MWYFLITSELCAYLYIYAYVCERRCSNLKIFLFMFSTPDDVYKIVEKKNDEA